MEVLEKFWLGILTFLGTALLAAIGAKVIIPYIKSISEGVARIEKEVKMNGAYQNALMHLSKEPIFQADGQGRCIFVNKAYTEMTGLHHKDCMGSGWIRAIAMDDKARVSEEWRQCVESNTEFSIEFKWTNVVSGIEYPSVCNATIVRVDDEVVGSIGVIEIN